MSITTKKNAYGRDVADEAKRIRDLKTWPYWPWLPMKRIGEDTFTQLGVIYADQIDIPGDDYTKNSRLTVWDAPWIPSMKAAVAITMGADPTWPVVGEYAGVEQMLEDGWVVD